MIGCNAIFNIIILYIFLRLLVFLAKIIIKLLKAKDKRPIFLKFREFDIILIVDFISLTQYLKKESVADNISY